MRRSMARWTRFAVEPGEARTQGRRRHEHLDPIPASSATLSLPVLERGGYGTVALHAVMSPLSNPSAKSGIGSW